MASKWALLQGSPLGKEQVICVNAAFARSLTLSVRSAPPDEKISSSSLNLFLQLDGAPATGSILSGKRTDRISTPAATKVDQMSCCHTVRCPYKTQRRESISDRKSRPRMIKLFYRFYRFRRQTNALRHIAFAAVIVNAYRLKKGTLIAYLLLCYNILERAQ